MRDLVRAARLVAGDRLPSSRALAADLGVSRTVTATAYDQLHAEGWTETRHGAGTFVRDLGAAGRIDPADPARIPGAQLRASEQQPRSPEPELLHLDLGTPWIDPRHRALWRRAWREVSATEPPRGYLDPRGLPELREAVADRLRRTRGVDVTADEVMITGGSTDGLRHLLAVLPDGPIAIEDPGYRSAVTLCRTWGRTVHDLPALEPVTSLADAVAAYVTPAHQHPLGVVMPPERRQALLAAAREADALVIEDDFDSELRWDVSPVPALAAWDRDRVALVGTASKSVSPSLRLGWLVAPLALHERIAALRTETHDSVPWATQRAFLSLLRDGYLDRVVRDARTAYARRLDRVREVLSPYADAVSPAAGMYLTLEMPHERAIAARDEARRAGFELNLLSGYCRTARRSGLAIGVGACDDAQLEVALAAIARGYDLSLGSARPIRT